jgi:hypothetical protein
MVRNIIAEVKLSSSRQVQVSEVFWRPPRRGCIKINIHGSSYGLPSCGAIGIVIHDWETKFLGGFVHNIGNASAYVTEVCAAMYALEKAIEMQWRDFWIETDSFMVVKAFSNHLEVLSIAEILFYLIDFHICHCS